MPSPPRLPVMRISVNRSHVAIRTLVRSVSFWRHHYPIFLPCNDVDNRSEPMIVNVSPRCCASSGCCPPEHVIDGKRDWCDIPQTSCLLPCLFIGRQISNLLVNMIPTTDHNGHVINLYCGGVVTGAPPIGRSRIFKPRRLSRSFCSRSRRVPSCIMRCGSEIVRMLLTVHNRSH
jgi:hypothetical protein